MILMTRAYLVLCLGQIICINYNSFELKKNNSTSFFNLLFTLKFNLKLASCHDHGQHQASIAITTPIAFTSGNNSSILMTELHFAIYSISNLFDTQLMWL